MNGPDALRLQFMHDTRTDVWIAEATGIPRSTLGFVRRGEREMPAQYTDALRTLYQGEAQRYLLKAGYPESTAVDYSSAMPSTLENMTGDLDHYIQKISILHTSYAEQKALDAGKAFDANAYQKEAFAKIKENIAKSSLSYQELLERFADYAREGFRLV